MKVNLVQLMRHGADALEQLEDKAGRAYALHEAANNMVLLLNGTDDLAEFQTCYVAGKAEVLDLDKRFPAPKVDE